MRTTLILNDELLREAQRLTGITEKTAVIHEALKLLVQAAAAQRLAELGGSDPTATAGPRRRSPRRRR